MIHRIKARVFCKNEDCEKLKSTLIGLFPFEIKKQFSESFAEGHYGDNIKIFEVDITVPKEIKMFLKELKSKISFSELESYVEGLVDDSLNLGLRLDKAELLEGKYKWVFDGDCFYLRFSILAFPKKRENVIIAVRKLFKE